jgi:hypothetical protein
MRMGGHTGSGFIAPSQRPQTDACFDVHLVMRDDPSPYAAPLERLLEGLHQSLVQKFVPRIFIVANGNPPPIMISFSAPTYGGSASGC